MSHRKGNGVRVTNQKWLEPDSQKKSYGANCLVWILFFNQFSCQRRSWSSRAALGIVFLNRSRITTSVLRKSKWRDGWSWGRYSVVMGPLDWEGAGANLWLTEWKQKSFILHYLQWPESQCPECRKIPLIRVQSGERSSPLSCPAEPPVQFGNSLWKHSYH